MGLNLYKFSGCSVARYRASMGCWRSEVRIFSSRLENQGLMIEKSKSFFHGSNIGQTVLISFIAFKYVEKKSHLVILNYFGYLE